MRHAPSLGKVSQECGMEGGGWVKAGGHGRIHCAIALPPSRSPAAGSGVQPHHQAEEEDKGSGSV